MFNCSFERKIEIKNLSEKKKKLIRSLCNLKNNDAQIISDIEIKGYKNRKATDHDKSR